MAQAASEGLNSLTANFGPALIDRAAHDAHLRAVLTEFVSFDNQERPHRTLILKTPIPIIHLTTNSIRINSILSKLHRVYKHTT